MLKQRVITALVLLALLLPTLFVRPAWPFALLTLLGFSAAGWEWSRLNGAAAAATLLAIGLGVACAVAFRAGWGVAAPPLAWWVATAVWVLGGAWLLRSGTVAWPQLPKGLRIGLGLALLWTAWLALVNAKSIGINFILSVFCLVWAADIAAYFGGRAFGRRKLAPAISPGKSWEGVWSGMAGAVLLAAIWLLGERSSAVDAPSLYAALQANSGSVLMALIVVFLVAMSVVGDLFES